MNDQTHFSNIYQRHAPYSPLDPYVSNIHVAEFNAITSTSALLTTLKTRDFAPVGTNFLGEEIFAINQRAVAALEHACEQLCLDLCEAGGALADNVVSPIKQELFNNLAMPCPTLLTIALRTAFSPLHAHGTREQLTRIFTAMQLAARDMALWMILARRRCAFYDDSLGWRWDDAGIVAFKDVFVGLPANHYGHTHHVETTYQHEPNSLIPALEQLRLDYPDTAVAGNDEVLTNPPPSPVSGIIPVNSEKAKPQLLLEYPERKLIQLPGYPLIIPRIKTTAHIPENDKAPLLIEYPDRRFITHPDYPFRIPLIPTNHQNHLEGQVTLENESTIGGMHGEPMEIEESENVKFYFDDPANVDLWLQSGNDGSTDVEMGNVATTTTNAMDIDG